MSEETPTYRGTEPPIAYLEEYLEKCDGDLKFEITRKDDIYELRRVR